MGKINYKKIFERLLEEYPHEIEKLEQVYSDAKKKEEHYGINIEFDEIIKSEIWSSDEKVRLLKLFGYNKEEHEMKYLDENYHEKIMPDYLYTISYDIPSGFEALMKIFKDIESHYIGIYISKDEAYRRVFNAVISTCQDEKKALYIKIILDNLTEDDIKRLIAPYYEGNSLTTVHNKSIFLNIIASQDLNLIKKYIRYVDDINMYLSEAVATGNIEIVKFFLEKGANINYLTDEVILGILPPLKTAICMNNFEMVKFLTDNGADVNLRLNSDDFINRLNNYQIDIFDRWNYDKRYHLEPVNEEDEDVKQLKYIRTSLPLEYAIKTKSVGAIAYNHIKVFFDGEAYNSNNELLVDIYNISEQVKNRGKIVDLIFDKLEDKTNINYSDLIGFTFITRDLEKFQKYSKIAIENNYQIDFDLLFKLYFDFHLNEAKEMIIPVMDLIAKYDKDNDLYLKLFDYYINNVVKNFTMYKFTINDFNKELLNRISEEKRRNICLVPHCKNLETLKYLLALGFDINGVDENGRNILYHLLCDRSKTTNFNDQEINLFNYLLENLNLSTKDKDNKTTLYYVMQKFDTKDEYQYARKDWIGTRSDLEKAAAVLISKMPKEDVCNDDIQKVLDERLEYCSDFGDKIRTECIYQHHKELFDALLSKGFVLSLKILSDIFENLYTEDKNLKARLGKDIDMQATLDYVYQKLDHNTETQKINIEEEYKKLLLYLHKDNITFENFSEKLIEFNNKIIALNSFYENNIKKKFAPKRYLQYAKKRFKTTYTNLNGYLFMIIIFGINKFGSEKLENILDLLPNYDINTRVYNADVGVNYWTYISRIYNEIGYDDDGNPIYSDEYFEAENITTDNNENISFTGDLIRYAILIDNLPMLKVLRERGGNLKFIVNRKDHTWDYVNSATMLGYLESMLGSRVYQDFDDEEEEYYLGLISKTE